ncbi:MAG: hypothetical protein JSU98_12480 [Gemmatimonadales bacterium]|jgi:hypothetical protein|nr:MAG: hypothetical protein JSU98_12480 [Gemmatimonadales bacterium]
MSIPLEQLAAWSQIIAALGVIASLVFVGRQIRESSKAVRSATTQAVHQNFGTLYAELAQNPEGLDTFLRGCVDVRALAVQEKEQFTCFAMAVMSFYQNAFDQWRMGHLRDDLWTGWETLLVNFLHTPGGTSFWSDRAYVFGTDFQAHMAEVMARPANPRATTFGIKIVDEAEPE